MSVCKVFIRYYTERIPKTVFFDQKMGGGVVGRRPALGEGVWDIPTPFLDGFCDCGLCSLPYLLEDADVP